MRYAAKKNATQYNDAGELKCDRCGQVVKPWFLVRADNCGNGAFSCLRAFGPVLQGWERERAKRAVKAVA